MLRTRQKQYRRKTASCQFVTAVNNARFFSVLADEIQERVKRQLLQVIVSKDTKDTILTCARKLAVTPA